MSAVKTSLMRKQARLHHRQLHEETQEKVCTVLARRKTTVEAICALLGEAAQVFPEGSVNIPV